MRDRPRRRRRDEAGNRVITANAVLAAVDTRSGMNMPAMPPRPYARYSDPIHATAITGPTIHFFTRSLLPGPSDRRFSEAS